MPFWCAALAGSQDSGQAVQYTLCRATTARKTPPLPPQTWWCSSIRMHPNHFDHPAFPQVIAVSRDDSEKMLFFSQTVHLTRLTTQIRQYQRQLKTGHTETATVKPYLQGRCIFFRRDDWIYDYEAISSWYKQGECKNSHSNLLVEYNTIALIIPATGALLTSQMIMFLIPFTFEKLILSS